MTVCWYVDDLKVSHKEESAIVAFVLKICNIFGNGTKFNRGKVHKYVVMDTDWSQDGTPIISIIKYLQKTIDDFPEVIRSTSSMYATEYLFRVRDEKERKLLPGEQAQQFHHIVAQLLFLCMRSHPDIQPLVAFLTTRVRYLDEDDRGKLKQGMNYLKGTLYMKLYLRVDYLKTILRWVDASYVTHWDCKSHTGAVMSIGVGEILILSRKQKLNTGSSTEAELVGITDMLGLMMWTKYFMEVQVNIIDINILFQDNQSTIMLAKNGRRSAGKNSKHIKNHYFLITDKVHQEDLKIRYKPTVEMMADYQ